jgi:hypothetical protein
MISETVCSCGLASRSMKWFEITSRGKSKGGRTCRHRLKIKASDQPMVRSRPTRHAFNGQCCLPLALHVRRIFRRPPPGLNEPIRVCLAHLPSLTAVALERTEILPIESRISSNIAFFFAPNGGSLGGRAIRCGEGRWPGDSNLSNADFLAAPRVNQWSIDRKEN